MKKIIIAAAVFILILGAGIGIKLIIDSQSRPAAGAAAVEPSAKAKPLAVAGIGGYTLGKIALDGESVPVVKIPLVTWGGYAALVAANGGLKPSRASLFYKYGKFAVELVREENPNKHIDGFASGEYPIIWSTMDTLPLIYHAVKNDKRIIPQVFGVFDWSFGGDGIIVRDYVKTPRDLKGKRIVTSGNTPSNFFLLWLLSQSGLYPQDVIIQYVDDAVQAKDAFIRDAKIDACVTWSPFLYEITDPQSKDYVQGARLLITSKDANQLIADVYLVRLDFLKNQKDLVYAFSQAMMEGIEEYRRNSPQVHNSLAALFALPDGPHEAELMLGDVHLANFPENLMFFDLDNPINALKIFYLSQEYYKAVGSLPPDAAYEAEIVVNASPLLALKARNLFAQQQNTVKNSFNRQGSFNIADLETKKVVLAEDVQIYFEPQRIDFDLASPKEEIRQNIRDLGKIAEQMNVLGTTVVKLVGHLDTTKVKEYKAQGQQLFIEASAQAKLISKRRAEFIKKVLIERYHCDAERILTEGKGWDQPVDESDQDKNRRVEVKFLSFE